MTGKEEPGRRVAVIGAGKVGTAMASALSSAGYQLVGISDRSPDARGRAASLLDAESCADSGEAARRADIVLITTPDGAVEEACRAVAVSADIRGKKFIHMSGALSLDALATAGAGGAETLCVHPLQTFADLPGALASLPGSTFGVTCAGHLEEWARGFVSDIGGRMLLVDDDDKAAYHAAAVMACNLMTMVQHGAESLCVGLGFTESEAREAFIPLVRATVENIARLGPRDAVTGPLARGDIGTIRSHLQALDGVDPELSSMYRAVSLWGLRLVAERGELTDEEIESMRNILE
ncbi:MAG: DUF2520 domain-containing protein [Actinobacteria bacterium]|nr:DUF2520 domain-containing protein [Actinomycetota bacterium]MBU4489881.1 DUF2520 domain-containing protein [Actinomycetota bacterium]